MKEELTPAMDLILNIIVDFISNVGEKPNVLILNPADISKIDIKALEEYGMAIITHDLIGEEDFYITKKSKKEIKSIIYGGGKLSN